MAISKPIKRLVKLPTQNKRAAEIAELEARLADPDDDYNADDAEEGNKNGLE